MTPGTLTATSDATAYDFSATDSGSHRWSSRYGSFSSSVTGCARTTRRSRSGSFDCAGDRPSPGRLARLALRSSVVPVPSRPVPFPRPVPVRGSSRRTDGSDPSPNSGFRPPPHPPPWPQAAGQHDAGRVEEGYVEQEARLGQVVAELHRVVPAPRVQPDRALVDVPKAGAG